MKWTLVFACALVASSCRHEIDLVELARAETRENGVVLGSETRSAIATPLASKVSFRVALPADAELRFSPALLTKRRVPRARVEFLVEASFDGRHIELYRRELRAGDENRWHDASTSAPGAGRP